MNKKLTTLLAALAILGALVGAKLQSGEERFVVFGGFNEQVMRTLTAQGEQLHWEGRNLILTTTDRDHLLASLSIAADAQEKAMRVYYQNRGNEMTVQGPSGAPYRRLSPAFDEQGIFVGVSVDDTDYFWTHEPNNPLAQKSGKRAGWVPYPNVCDVRENVLITVATEQICKLAVTMTKVGPDTQTTQQQGMFSMMGSSNDPFSTISNRYFDMRAPATPPQGHQCTAACVSMPDDFPIVDN